MSENIRTVYFIRGGYKDRLLAGGFHHAPVWLACPHSFAVIVACSFSNFELAEDNGVSLIDLAIVPQVANVWENSSALVDDACPRATRAAMP